MLTVLIVEDEPAILELVRFTLEDDRVRILEAADGAAALALAAAERPDIVLLDVRLGHLDGVEVCRRIRANAALAATRVVMLTAADQEADRARGLAAGADEYLSKPFSPLALLALVRTILPEAPTWPET